MRRRLIESPSIYVGDLTDCASVDAEWSVVHANYRPCTINKCFPPKPGFASTEDRNHLWLNLENGVESSYSPVPFMDFLKWAKIQSSSNRPMLIHSEHGHSRAPMMALLFLAKILHRIRNATFDQAWADFEKVAGERFTPNEGLEIWMREHWRELDMEKRVEVPSIPKVLTAAIDFRKLTPQQNRAIIESNPLLHFGAFLQIEKKNNAWERPAPNILQRKIAEAYAFCMERGIPCRLVILKPRQVGCSTFCVALCRAHARRFRCDMLILSDTDKRVQLLWSMLRGFNAHDSFPWRSSVTKENTEVIEITFPDNEKGEIKHDTAADDKAGTGGTRQIIIWNEASKYERSNARDQKVFMTSNISLAQVPQSIGIMESTADGAAGVFHETFKGAVSLADRKSGKRNDQGQLLIGNNFISIFAAWHEFQEYSLKRTEETAQWFNEDLDDRERRGIDLYGWTPEQVAWRRSTIKDKCNGDPRQFDQDYPEDPEIAFLTSGRPRFDQKGIAAMEKVARAMHSRAEVGALDRAGKAKDGKEEGPVGFRQCCDGESWLWVAEKPTYGLSYIGFVDPATGEQSEGSMFPDSHGAGIWRAGYFEKQKWHPPKLAAVIDVPNGCRWDDDVLAIRMKRILDWYGDPIVIVDIGNGLGTLGELRRAGCNLYEREKMDAMYPGKTMAVAGFHTNAATRPFLINEMAKYVREFSEEDPSWEVWYLPLISELRTFVVDNREKAKAKHGCHDDILMGCAMGIFKIDLAQKYMPRDIGWGGFGEGGVFGGLGPKSTLPGGLAATAFS